MLKDKLVHLDIKADYVFIDDVLNQDFGDFGSTRSISEPVWKCTKVFTPYVIRPGTRVIPAMDVVLFCAFIAVDVDKNEWKKLLQKELNTIENGKRDYYDQHVNQPIENCKRVFE